MTQKRVTFGKSVGFRKELNRRVEAYFISEDLAQRDHPALYLKTGIIFAWIISAWTFTIFYPAPVGWKLIGCVFLGLGLAALGFNVGHDANHGSYSEHQLVNRILGLSYDLFMGVSSYLWRFNHNFIHHTYTNISGHDFELDWDGWVRRHPDKPHEWYHQFQHLFVWLIHVLMPGFWFVSELNLIVFKRRAHEYTLPKIKRSQLIAFFTLKLLWLGMFLGVPLIAGYTPMQAIVGFCLTYMTGGLVTGVILMLAHVVETAEFLDVSSQSPDIDDEWAICQVKTTVDFAPNNKFCNWYLGGLNYQVVHHLFPQVCHIHYANLAPIVSQVCQEFGVEYKVYGTLLEAIAANHRWLKTMGITPHT
ncbi:fatty acid desaturase [Lyngbya aestuarii]|uniref:fatty acid desaturase n=1 Tax=Lyngbya aestuarii TaxID=118322 RepID=UPI00403DFC78